METKKKSKIKSRKTVSLKVKVLGPDGKSTATIKVAKGLFGLKPKLELISQVIRVYLANQRAVGVAVKTRAEIKGSTRKIYRQKGTGRARHGSRKAPIFVGGGIAHGPKKRSYRLSVNKKQKKKALFYALSLKFSQANILALDDKFVALEAKTKIFGSFLEKIDSINKQILLVLDFKKNNNLFRAARNLANVTITSSKTINPYLVLRADKLLFLKDSLKDLEKR